MKPQNSRLPPGLTLVATPIGNARDITLRALDVLAGADVLAAGVALYVSGMLAPQLLGAIAEGKSVAYASEAGTPMISDPGFDLARAALSEGYSVTAAPGASAVITALTVAGLPTDRFFFAGFLPNAGAARRAALEALVGVPGTLVFYESPKRLGAMLRVAAEVLGETRRAAICRELTKKFEEVRRGSLAELAEFYENSAARGEVVVLIDRGDSPKISESDVTQALETALATMSVRDAAEAVSAMFGVKKRAVYQEAMALQKDRRDGDD